MRRLLNFFVILGLIGFWGCGGGQKARKAMSVVDSPEIHYSRGKDLLQKEKLNDAMFEFKQANSLNPKYAPAYEGMAWVYLEQGNLKAALSAVEKALDLDGKWALAKIVRAKVYAKQGKFEEAIKEARKAIKAIPKSTVPDKRRATIEAYLALGDIYKEADRYDEAQGAYMRVLEIDKTNMRADRAIKQLAEYKTAVSGQRPELRKIAKQKAITRADVAVLFVLELPLEKIFRQSKGPQAATFRPPTSSIMGKKKKPGDQNPLPPDVPQNHWARSFIQEALQRNVLELFPDGTFRPDEEVNRAEFARLIEKFLVRYWNDASLETKFFGSASPFADVNNTSPIFNAIMLVSSRNIIPGYDDGTFRPLEPVSGTEALNIIRRLKAQL